MTLRIQMIVYEIEKCIDVGSFSVREVTGLRLREGKGLRSGSRILRFLGLSNIGDSLLRELSFALFREETRGFVARSGRLIARARRELFGRGDVTVERIGIIAWGTRRGRGGRVVGRRAVGAGFDGRSSESLEPSEVLIFRV